MFKARDDLERDSWVENFKSAIEELESSTLSQSSRAQTLPASASAPEKKKGFFTLKRK